MNNTLLAFPNIGFDLNHDGQHAPVELQNVVFLLIFLVMKIVFLACSIFQVYYAV